jgi:hypothetical protein
MKTRPCPPVSLRSLYFLVLVGRAPRTSIPTTITNLLRTWVRMLHLGDQAAIPGPRNHSSQVFQWGQGRLMPHLMTPHWSRKQISPLNAHVNCLHRLLFFRSSFCLMEATLIPRRFFCHACGLFIQGERSEALEMLVQHQCTKPIVSTVTFSSSDAEIGSL